MKRALIFAAGSGKRWPSETPKQLVEVEGEIVIDRTIRQLKERGVDCWVVTRDPRLERPGTKAFTPTLCRWLVETILATKEIWRDDMILLLGDVWFSDRCINKMVEAKGTHWFGRQDVSYLSNGPSEVWGCTWNADDCEDFVESMEVELQRCIELDKKAPVRLDKEAFNLEEHLRGSLWQPYRYLAGVPIDSHRFDTSGLWVEVHDWTDDFDTPEHFAQWKARFRNRWIVQGMPSLPEQKQEVANG